MASSAPHFGLLIMRQKKKTKTIVATPQNARNSMAEFSHHRFRKTHTISTGPTFSHQHFSSVYFFILAHSYGQTHFRYRQRSPISGKANAMAFFASETIVPEDHHLKKKKQGKHEVLSSKRSHFHYYYKSSLKPFQKNRKLLLCLRNFQFKRRKRHFQLCP